MKDLVKICHVIVKLDSDHLLPSVLLGVLGDIFLDPQQKCCLVPKPNTLLKFISMGVQTQFSAAPSLQTSLSLRLTRNKGS